MPSSSTNSGTPRLPPEITVLERGWLSANNILFIGAESTALVDTGYCTHAAQTVALLEGALQGRPLDRVLNTHLHSDHCGGNAALQQTWPALRTFIPPGQADHVRQWDANALSYTPTGQDCPPFRMDGVLQPGTEVLLGDRAWQVHAAPGHDPHSVVLFEPADAVMISADALWENGFGVVFPELEGDSAFAEVAATLDLIESLAPRTLIPGHGRVFTDLARALDTARRRLAGFVQSPEKHARYAAKVLVKYKLLEWQRIESRQLWDWAGATPYFALLHQRYFSDQSMQAWLDGTLQDLVRSGAAAVQGSQVHNV
ncbi:MBL fold metallo-hydrolase [Paracidovorax valerianellae]|uniref:Glyoxylase, beta-lactamase superfamily II n=1 Tax=Paracidovorax valerianellae TaxID=187868 RepID=A0A1G7F2Z2_9BURK|nr:MBL fold metallo-hydrolase [Paracidovorax valerianellae]MDA8445160.1 MBL fold metallo-hydrolase [Paracidovorax valerianellae]SDE70269.1 Glyoxylase, beta-lactamase superfamily II [Paracidovorax valerianellae]